MSGCGGGDSHRRSRNRVAIVTIIAKMKRYNDKYIYLLTDKSLGNSLRHKPMPEIFPYLFSETLLDNKLFRKPNFYYV
jgi:hypothetical protein